MHTAPREFAALDFEFARLRDGGGDAPIQVGIAATRCGSLHPEELFCSLLHPGQPVRPTPGCSVPANGAALSDAPTLLSLWPELRARLSGRILLAHGSGTEKRLLLAFPGHGLGPWIDTLLLARSIFPSLPSHSLSDLCSILRVDEELPHAVQKLPWHDALRDAAACLQLFFRLTAAAGISPHDPRLLHAPDLRKYFASRKELPFAAPR